VAVAFVPELPKSRASGATRWLSASKALVQLSLRYKTNDHLWFTFFHEAAHILLHGKRLIFLESHGSTQSDEEKEGNWRWHFELKVKNSWCRSISAHPLPGACTGVRRHGFDRLRRRREP